MHPERRTSSHKGDNGNVLIVGGNELFHGAPILAGLSAEQSGADLVYLMVPKNHQNLSRQFSLNLIVDTFKGKFLRPLDVKHVLDWTEKVDVMVIGNGLGERPQTNRAVRKILQKSKCHLVVDAAALLPFLEVAPLAKDREVVLTPHRGELSKMLAEDVEKLSTSKLKELLKSKAAEWEATIVLKGPEDLIVSPDGKIHINETGHPIMTKGGTGDVLAGMIGGMMAQGFTGFSAAKASTKLWGKMGEAVAKKKGLTVTVEELLRS